MTDVQGLRRSLGIKRLITHSFGVAAATAMMMSLTPSAHAVSLINPGTAPAARQASDALVTHVQHRGGHGGGGFRGGGGGFRGGGHAFHGGGGGGFRGGGMHAFHHGGGFRAAAPAFRGGGFHHRPAFIGGGYRRGPAFHGGYRHYAPRVYGHRHHFGPRYYGYAPRYYQPRRFCRVVWTHYGPRKICRYRPWHHRHWHRRHHHRFNVYW